MAYLQGEWEARDEGDPNTRTVSFGNESYSFSNRSHFGGGSFHDESGNPFFNNPFRSDLIRIRFDEKKEVCIFRREEPDRMVQLDANGKIITVYVRRK
jgi:hypothetical protein